MVHGLETLEHINREAAAKATLDLIEKGARLHHQTCYNQSEFAFVWTELDCPGIWAFGGPHQDDPPVFLWARFSVPESDRKPGWYCYIGPRPEFSNEVIGKVRL